MKKDYEQTPERKLYKTNYYKKQAFQKLLSAYSTDTGFDVICSCCLQYKNLDACENVETLSANQQKKFTVGACYILKNRSNDFFICKLCKKDIHRSKQNAQKKS